MDMISQEVKNWSSITENIFDQETALPDHMESWLLENLEGTTIKTYIPQLPEGSLGMLVPKTKIVVNTKVFIWQLVKLYLLASVVEKTRLIVPETKILVPLSIWDSLSKLVKSIVKLDEDQGQHCVYVAVANTGRSSAKLFPQYSDADQIWVEHKALKKSCKLNSCIHYDKGCKLKRKAFENVLLTLEKKKVLKNKAEQWKVVL